MYKQGESKQQTLFYFYKENHLTFKTANESKVRVNGKLPNLSVTLLHVTAEDIGLYWCEFNFEEKNTVGKFTWLWIGKCILLHVNNCILKHDEFIILIKEKDCPEDTLPIVKIIPIVCAVILFISVICCMIMKVSIQLKSKSKVKTKLMDNLMRISEVHY
ncbi:hypothetical protein PO909_005802 [Leuciscus waleckii]